MICAEHLPGRVHWTSLNANGAIATLLGNAGKARREPPNLKQRIDGRASRAPYIASIRDLKRSLAPAEL